MVSVLKDRILVIDLPKKIYEMQKKGYDHFEADFENDTRRLLVRAWKRPELKRTLSCLECTRKFLNAQALAVHRRLTHKH